MSASVFTFFIVFSELTHALPWTYIGRDKKTGVECGLRIIDFNFDTNTAPQNRSAVADILYGHHGEQPPRMRLRPHPQKNDVLWGEGDSDQTQVAVFFQVQAAQFKPIIYNLKWQHGNHAHTLQCQF